MKIQNDDLLQEQKSIDCYPLPEGWKWVTVNDAGADQKNAIVDGPFGSNLKVSDYVENGTVPVLTTKNLEGNYDQARYISQEKFEELKRSAVYPGDILMAKIGSCGKTGIYPANKPPAMIPANLLKVTLNEMFELKYVYHYFNSLFFQRALRTITKATAQPAFGVTNFRKLPLPYVERTQQKLIVAEIEKQFSRLDEAVTNLKRVKANLKRYKAAVLKAAVEGRLVETEAELARREGRSYETGEQLLQRILETRRSQWQGKGKYKEPASPDTTDLPELPEGWGWSTYQQVGRLQLGRQRAPKYHNGPNMRQYLRVQNVFEDNIDLGDVMEMDFSPEDFEKYKLEDGDLLLNEGQSPEFLGRPAIYRGELPGACFTNTLIRFRALEGVSVEYALLLSRHYMHAGRFVDEGTITTNIAHLSIGRLSTVEFPLPPTVEQHRIVSEVDRQLTLLRVTEVQVDANLQRAERLRQALLRKAFGGGLANSENKTIEAKEMVL